jgi:hypothetical protein
VIHVTVTIVNTADGKAESYTGRLLERTFPAENESVLMLEEFGTGDITRAHFTDLPKEKA